MTIFTRVLTKARKHYPATPTEYYVAHPDKNTITVKRIWMSGYGADRKTSEQSATFKVGDTAEYDSYNLSYCGTILKITPKTVVIKESHDDRTHRLDLHTFSYRNYNFDLQKITARNSDTMMYI